jgi:hypothetical protein
MGPAPEIMSSPVEALKVQLRLGPQEPLSAVLADIVTAATAATKRVKIFFILLIIYIGQQLPTKSYYG